MSADLSDLLSRGAWATITNPVHGSSWSGRLIAMHDDPGVIIEQADGVRLCLPQSFTITECEPLEPAGLPAALAKAERIIADRDRDMASLMTTVAQVEAELTGLRGRVHRAESALAAAGEPGCICAELLAEGGDFVDCEAHSETGFFGGAQ